MKQIYGSRYATSFVRQITCCLLFALLIVPLYSSGTIKLSKNEKLEINLQPLLLYYVGDQQAFSLEQILSIEEQFFKPTDNHIGTKLPRTGDHIIYRFDLKNINTVRSVVLHLDDPMLSHIDIYHLENDKLIKHAQIGSARPIQPTTHNSLPHIRLELQPKQSSRIYIQIRSTSKLNLPIKLYDVDTFQHQINKHLIIFGCFIGITLLIIGYNCLTFYETRRQVYLLQILYTVTLTLLLGVYSGFGFYLLPFTIHSPLIDKLPILHYGNYISAILLSLYFLRYDISKCRIYRLGLYFCSILFIQSLLVYAMPGSIDMGIELFTSILFFTFIILICRKKISDKAYWVHYYLISWIPMLIVTLIYYLQQYQIISSHLINQNIFVFVTLLQITLISIALAKRYQHHVNERLYNVTHDSVTQLPNNILFNECATKQITKDRPFTLILFRAERFAEIKPALGLEAANNLITAIIKNVSGYFQQMDYLLIFEKNETSDTRLSRISDDTFGLIIPGEYQREELTYIVLTIQEAVSTPIDVGGYNISTPCSVGIISYPMYGANAELLIEKAKHALGLANKDDCKYNFYNGEQNTHVQDQLLLAAELQKAIDDDALEIYHQPQINLDTSTVCGHEALLRWIHPTRGFISPEVFIPLAEDTGIINQLTEWVISRSLQQHKDLCQLGFEHPISINLSGKDLTQPGLIVHIMTTIADLELVPSTIIFELTESATSDDPIHALKTINQLHELGLKIAIDDFGTGYSSLENLSKLPFHELKVDKSFILDLITSDRDQAITKTTIEMAKNLGIFVVAEGIETKEVENLLKSYDCELGQGYLYSKPLPLKDYMQWLQGSSPYVLNYTKTSNLEPIKQSEYVLSS